MRDDRRRRACAALLIWLLLPLGCAAGAQDPAPRTDSRAAAGGAELSDNASLAETLNWLKGQLVNNSKYRIKLATRNGWVYSDYKVQSVTFEGCAMTLKDIMTETTLSGRPVTTHRYEYRFDLSDLDAARVALNAEAAKSFGNYTVRAYTLGDRWVVGKHYEFRSRASTSRDDRPDAQINFVFRGEEAAQKFIRALKHAVELCRARKAGAEWRPGGTKRPCFIVKGADGQVRERCPR